MGRDPGLFAVPYLAAGSWELGAGSWELGAGSWELDPIAPGAGSDRAGSREPGIKKPRGANPGGWCAALGR